MMYNLQLSTDKWYVFIFHATILHKVIEKYLKNENLKTKNPNIKRYRDYDNSVGPQGLEP